MLRLSRGERPDGAEVHALAALQGVARRRVDPERASGRRDAQYPPLRRAGAALPGPPEGDHRRAQEADGAAADPPAPACVIGVTPACRPGRKTLTASAASQCRGGGRRAAWTSAGAVNRG